MPVRHDCMARLEEASAIEDVKGVAVLAREGLYDLNVGINCDAIMDMSIDELMI